MEAIEYLYKKSYLEENNYYLKPFVITVNGVRKQSGVFYNRDSSSFSLSNGFDVGSDEYIGFLKQPIAIINSEE